MRLLKVATPALTVTVVVLPPAKPPGPLATDSVTWSVLSLVVKLPKRSNARTVTAGLTATPATVVLGWTLKARWLAAAGTTVKLAETGPVMPPVPLSDRENTPADSSHGYMKVAMPSLTVAVVVLLSVKPPGTLATDSVFPTRRSSDLKLPKRSNARTVTAGLTATPATVVPGWTPKARWSAAAGTTVKLAEAGPVMPPVPL